jgi:hypothetical protein
MMSTHFPPTVVQAKLLQILHRAFVQARNLALAGNGPQIAELADTFEVLPEMMRSWGPTSLNQIRDLLAEYETNHPQAGYSYRALLDVDEAAFLAAESTPFSPVSDVDPEGNSSAPPARA